MIEAAGAVARTKTEATAGTFHTTGVGTVRSRPVTRRPQGSDHVIQADEQIWTNNTHPQYENQMVTGHKLNLLIANPPEG